MDDCIQDRLSQRRRINQPDFFPLCLAAYPNNRRVCDIQPLQNIQSGFDQTTPSEFIPFHNIQFLCAAESRNLDGCSVVVCHQVSGIIVLSVLREQIQIFEKIAPCCVISLFLIVDLQLCKGQFLIGGYNIVQGIEDSTGKGPINHVLRHGRCLCSDSCITAVRSHTVLFQVIRSFQTLRSIPHISFAKLKSTKM